MLTTLCRPLPLRAYFGVLLLPFSGSSHEGFGCSSSFSKDAHLAHRLWSLSLSMVDMIEIHKHADMADCKALLHAGRSSISSGRRTKSTEFHNLADVFNISPLPDQISLMRFSKSVSICMIHGSLILPLSNVSHATPAAPCIWACLCASLLISAWSFTPMLIGLVVLTPVGQPTYMHCLLVTI